MSGTWHRNWLWVYLVLDFVANDTEPKEFKVKSRAARDHEPQKAVYGGRGASVGLGGMLEGRERKRGEGRRFRRPRPRGGQPVCFLCHCHRKRNLRDLSPNQKKAAVLFL